ncbi:MAG: rod shape-determining protein MreD [Muribaculaceae bacterium]|nr:rod shape-determining protein MreD [Muribaculaceae bacterium]
MSKTVIQFVVLFIVLTLLQVVCNKIILFGVATPIIFIYLLLRLPVNLSKMWMFSIAFFTGLVIDIFGNTPGMNSLSCTIASALRAPVYNLFVSHDGDDASALPSIATLGMGNYLKYMATMVIIYCALLFFVQAFTLNDLVLTIERTCFSSLLSIFLILGIDSLVSTTREKRL